MSDTKIEDVSNTPPAPSFVDRATSPAGISVIVFLIILLSLGVYLYARKSPLLSFLPSYSKQQRVPTVTPTPTPTPRPIKELPGGKQVYNVSNGPKVIGPKIQQITLDPQTPSLEATQTVTIKVKNDSPVTEAIAYVQTDNKELRHIMNLIQGTTTDGTWQASWKMSDTYNYTYYIRFDLKSATGEYNDGIRLRE